MNTTDQAHADAIHDAFLLRGRTAGYDQQTGETLVLATWLAERGDLLGAGMYLRATASTFRALDAEREDLRRIQGQFYDELYGRTRA